MQAYDEKRGRDYYYNDAGGESSACRYSFAANVKHVDVVQRSDGVNRKSLEKLKTVIYSAAV